MRSRAPVLLAAFLALGVLALATRAADGSWTFDDTAFGAHGRNAGFPLIDPDGVIWFGQRGRLCPRCAGRTGARDCL